MESMLLFMFKIQFKACNSSWIFGEFIFLKKDKKADINTFMEKLVSWETVSTRLESAIARAVQREQEGTETEDEENPDDQEPEVYLDSDIDVSEVD
ncbi:hypothetical protein ISN45_At04g000820 [Arabidopsis thaliana x Arabidopsis arenosa]|uniref:Fe superoxide dismutase n=4 Tax=Arabidopsis TaxID=3701 RepID=F4JHF1_ARATH|nr:Fe superoxide dismutase [Arabidopsis thaliana]AEE81914.1 Fe superoxide dismutase [Arabidopsis thaliana]KAG7614660.1 hypothetical protein ISN45_At04g000820 [Arabidopsis thaliana x Arabidopsis arenosa]KAG7619150.1 hypothetical protein ISN44_As04g000810 [Arabidopsis suecica]|eukprot:NP_001154195.1 Fe superoxide dismutase [Arabidopsis thaliana]